MFVLQQTFNFIFTFICISIMSTLFLLAILLKHNLLPRLLLVIFIIRRISDIQIYSSDSWCFQCDTNPAQVYENQYSYYINMEDSTLYTHRFFIWLPGSGQSEVNTNNWDIIQKQREFRARAGVGMLCCVDGNVKVLGVAWLYCPQDGGCWLAGAHHQSQSLRMVGAGWPGARPPTRSHQHSI